MCKSKVNRDSSQFLFGQTVRVHPCERFDQCTLTVIDMARGGHDEMLNPGHDPFSTRPDVLRTLIEIVAAYSAVAPS
jgi:hypothetical protein